MTANNSTAPDTRKRIGKTLLKVMLSLGLLAFFVSQAGLEQILAELSGANLWYVPVGVGIYLISQLVSAYRWQFLSKALGIRLSLREFYDYYLLGMFYSLFLPGSIGGDVARILYLSKASGKRKRETTLTLLAERGVGLVALLMMTSLLLLTPLTDPIPWLYRVPLLGLSLAFLVGYLILQKVNLEAWGVRVPKLALVQQAEVYWRNFPLLARSVSLSLGVHVCMVLIHFFIAQGLGVTDVSLPYLAAVYGIVSLVSVIPLFFNGIGLREGAYVVLLTMVGVPQHTAVAFGLYWFVISSLTSLFGLLVMIRGHYRTPVSTDELSQGEAGDIRSSSSFPASIHASEPREHQNASDVHSVQQAGEQALVP